MASAQENIFSFLKKEDRDKLREKAQPGWISPMLATRSKKHFSDENWIFERKLDGERCLVFHKGKDSKLMSRNKKKLNNQYPEIVEAFKKQENDFIIDGEIVAFEGNKSSFSRLQARMHRNKPDTGVKVYFYAFDILHLNGYETTGLSLRTRKEVLKKALKLEPGIIRHTEYRNAEGEKYLEEACKKGWEGLIAKDSNSTYVNDRSKKWLKFKCDKSQELIICGYTPPQGSRKHFGALIVGYYEKGNLKHAGKVGTGYDEETLENLSQKMAELEQKENPFEGEEPAYDEVTWLKPELVGEFRFTEWTGDNKLRHPSFKGLREDKKAKDVIKES